MTAHIEVARRQIEFARSYTRGLIEDVDDGQWFEMPGGAATHIAWQIGHLAMAQYGLCLFRIRGRKSEDSELMSSRFRKQFSKGSTPNPDPEQNPSPQEIRDALDRIHQQAMQELSQYTDADLEETIDEPYAVFNNKLGGLLFCAAHEMMHAGQIGLLRRLLGKDPLR